MQPLCTCMHLHHPGRGCTEVVTLIDRTTEQIEEHPCGCLTSIRTDVAIAHALRQINENFSTFLIRTDDLVQELTKEAKARNEPRIKLLN